MLEPLLHLRDFLPRVEQVILRLNELSQIDLSLDQSRKSHQSCHLSVAEFAGLEIQQAKSPDLVSARAGQRYARIEA